MFSSPTVVRDNYCLNQILHCMISSGNILNNKACILKEFKMGMRNQLSLRSKLRILLIKAIYNAICLSTVEGTLIFLAGVFSKTTYIWEKRKSAASFGLLFAYKKINTISLHFVITNNKTDLLFCRRNGMLQLCAKLMT